ncbi:MAG: 2-octaprenyl-6-methoxyphenol hydroxylase [Candidatus Tokpelaia sp. JSC085]|nr:MAG: 2-octaprenyl-6-methoxyphenol hydroxylase [Candidatus Tokpelaia sp. JSC085]
METTVKNIMTGQLVQKVDLVIAGGAHVGLSLAVSVKKAAPKLHVVVVDAAKCGIWKTDSRTSAIAAATVRMLDMLQCWQSVLPNAEPIREMIVTDSRILDPIRPIFLTFSGNVKPDEPFAYMVENRHLYTSLYHLADELDVKIVEGVQVEKFDMEGQNIRVYLENGVVYKSSLLVGADGVHSNMRNIAGIKTFYKPYEQTGIVCVVAHDRPHNGRAEEHFLSTGPFAILPLKGNRSSLVWIEHNEQAKQLLAADNMLFQTQLEIRFGHHLGRLRVESSPLAYPLGLTLAREFIRPCFALAGDAAHGIHPIAGQGLNLGFRDAAALAEIIVETTRLGLHIGSLVALERYQIWRRFETVRMGVTTDVLNRLFSNDCMPLRVIRDIGLGLVDGMPWLKNYLIQQAAGLIKGSPRLLLGEPI